jgi:hypothetical protein
MNPLVTIVDGITGSQETRELTDEEYAEFLASGWSETDPDDEAQA